MALRCTLAFLLVSAALACGQVTVAGGSVGGGATAAKAVDWVKTGFSDGTLGNLKADNGTDTTGDATHGCAVISDSTAPDGDGKVVSCQLSDNVCPNPCGGATQFRAALSWEFCNSSAPWNSGTSACNPAGTQPLWIAQYVWFDTDIFNAMDDSPVCDANATNFKWTLNRFTSGTPNGWNIMVNGEVHDCDFPTDSKIADDGGVATPLWTGISMGPEVWRAWAWRIQWDMKQGQACSSTWTKLRSASTWTQVETDRCFATSVGDDDVTRRQAITLGIASAGPWFGANWEMKLDQVYIGQNDPRAGY